MTVVAIVGILSVAYPSYAEYVRRGHRAEAMQRSCSTAVALERAATATGTYPLTASFLPR